MAAVEPRPQEMQLLVHPQQQARELQGFGVVQPSLPVPSPAAAPPLDAETEYDSRMRWRVVCISAVIAVYVVINALLKYIFDMAAIEDTLEKVRDVTDFKGGPTATTLLLNMVPGVGMSIAMGMLVPLCGYVGARQSQKWMIGCFCGCNALSCCTAIASLVCILLFSSGVQVLAPRVELFFEECDPMQCVTKTLNGTDEAHLVDCLAAGTWKDYTPRFAGPRYPSKCQAGMQRAVGAAPCHKHHSTAGHSTFGHPAIHPMFLKCNNFNSTHPMFLSDSRPVISDAEETGLPYGTFVSMGDDTAPEESQQGDIDDADAPVRAAGMGDYGAFLASEVPMTTQLARSSKSSWSPHKDLRRLRFALGQLHQKRQAVLRFSEEDCQTVSPPMPKDPVAQCSPAETVKQFHQIRMLVPVLVPQLQLYMLMRGLLLLPLIIIGCLGFCWGKDLFARLNAGYNPVGSSHLNTHPQVLFHPALGVAATGPATMPGANQMQMAQPLILNAPPAQLPPQITAIHAPQRP